MPDESPIDTEKRVAAEAAAELVEDGMTVGLGTGSTVAFLLPAARRRESLDPLRRHLAGDRAARAASSGIEVEPFDGVDRLDIAIDGADQVTPDGWLIKGGGGAHVREKIVAAAAERFVVIVRLEQAGGAALAAGAARARRRSGSPRRCGSSATMELRERRRALTAA